MKAKNKKFPEGHFIGMWIGIGVAIFAGVGIPLSFALDNPGLIGIGPGIGVAIGAAIGQSVENKYKKEGKIRPLTEEERRRKQLAVIGGLILLILGICAFLFMYLRVK